jgi:ribose transport system ATP-binding protein
MKADAKEVLDRVNLPVDPGEFVGNLSVAKRQMVEIAKALSKNAKIIVLDEPTAVLADEELKTLFELVKSLSGQGISFVYISHRLKEIFELCNKVTIMKDGQLVENGMTKDYDTDKLVEKMVGRQMSDIYPSRDVKIGDVVLKVDSLTRQGVLDNVSLELHKGEVLGLAGLAGAGRTETLRAIIGADKIDSGKITLFGKERKFDNIKQALEAGFGIVPEERKVEGLQLNNSLVFNVSLPALPLYSNKFGKIIRKKETDAADKYIKLFNIRTPGRDANVKNLSGGNQQKVVLGKWIAADCKILLVDEPTRGVDVGSKREIYTILNSLLEQGLSIIMVSSELPELIGTCDRICVMNEGRITGELQKDEFSEETIMRYATM